MKIAVDAGCLGIGDTNLRVGVYQVVRNLFIELGKIDRVNQYLLYSFLPIEEKLLASFGPNVRNILIRPTKGWMKVWLPLQLQRDRPDIFLGLSQALPRKLPLANFKTISFVYDIAFDKYPDMYPDSRVKLQKQTAFVMKNSNHIITISQTTKQDLIEKYTVSEEEITVCYPGVRSLTNGKDATPANMMHIERPYFLFVGALKRIKNVPTIIIAFSQFLEKSKKEYTLYVVGGSKWYDTEIDKALRAIPPAHKERIRFLGFVDDITLPSLYKGATAFVSPSLYEGFGLPFVEAMNMGSPIIGSTAGSIPEIVGDAGILIDPLDIEGLVNAMERMAAYTSLRLKLEEQGKKRAKQFSWENFASEVVTVINTV